MRIAIIGAGASGLAAAIQAKRTNSRQSVMLFEKNQRVGKKILVTGNGKCNLSNVSAGVDSYFPNGDFVKNALEQYGVEDTLGFFESLGLYTYTDDEGRVYPLSNQASTVLDVLRFECDRLGVETLCNYKVKTVEKHSKGYMINGTFFFDRIIVACGGKSNQIHGSDGFGFDILSSFGHTVKNVRPALVPLICEDFPKNLKGVRSQCNCSLYEDGELTVECSGEVQFADYGLSGIPIMNISGFADIESGASYEVAIDLAPSLEKEDVISFINDRIKMDANGRAENLLSGIVNKQLGLAVIKMCAVGQNETNSDIRPAQAQKIADMLKCWRVKVKATKGFDFSQVTAGGVSTDEFYPETLESKFSEGLYACGEVLDVFSECGGFNLQWAWSSGRLAGKSAAEADE